ncbi:PAAR domain-containing protein [Providencia alcalifaciens]|uniref:PAAR domain-containing protein n=1 Tax=Providencia alcalifaciens TaxID=126385 RepID=UPI001CE08183|nr:PAAR domain-containing protein [Providencia alcalifaciens]UBX50064.1 PAAR domain-containing protein [Providencia alcalifaciens]
MAIGYFLRVGDKTTCGGQILTGDNTMQWYGVAGAREGDMVSCGKHSGRFYIIGGCQSVWDEGRKVAGTLESISSCPCRARFINSIQDCYSDEYSDKSSTIPPVSPSILPSIVTQKICISCLMKAAESGQMLVVREG